MAKQTVNLGTAPTGVDGDTNRSAATKFQANDNEIYSFLGNGLVLPSALSVAKGGTGNTQGAAQKLANARSINGVPFDGTKDIDITMLRSFGTNRTLSPADVQKLSIIGGVTTLDSASGSTDFADIIVFNTWIDSTVGGVTAIASSKFRNEVYYFRGGLGASTWNTKLRLAFITETRNLSNTTVDGNGFIKAASPIVQLFADHIELNDDAEKQEITFTKNTTGDYLVSGSLGFAQDGWYIEMPKDANGNVLVAVVYEQLSNNAISVKTYKKKFDLETASIVADLDNPIDIPVGRWIDLRLEDLPVEPAQEGTPNEPNE